jgi:hypothetical protein
MNGDRRRESRTVGGDRARKISPFTQFAILHA